MIWSGYCDEALALFARMAVQPNTALKELINTTIVDYKACGYWDLCDVIVRFNTFDAQSGLLNWKDNTINATNVNSCVFTSYYGYAGDSLSKYINTNFTPSTGVNYQLNNAHAYIDCYVADDATNKADGALSTPNNYRLNWSPNAAFSINNRINCTSQGDTKKVITGNNFYGRQNSTEMEGWHEGVKTTVTVVSTGRPTIPVYLFRVNYAIGYYHSSRYCGYSFGGYIDDTMKAAVKATNDYFNTNVGGTF